MSPESNCLKVIVRLKIEIEIQMEKKNYSGTKWFGFDSWRDFKTFERIEIFV